MRDWNRVRGDQLGDPRLRLVGHVRRVRREHRLYRHDEADLRHDHELVSRMHLRFGVPVDPGVCMTDGHCATSGEVIFVEFNSSGCPAPDGSSAKPYCAPNDAVAVLTGDAGAFARDVARAGRRRKSDGPSAIAWTSVFEGPRSRRPAGRAFSSASPTVAEVAERLGVCRSTVFQLCERGSSCTCACRTRSGCRSRRSRSTFASSPTDRLSAAENRPARAYRLGGNGECSGRARISGANRVGAGSDHLRANAVRLSEGMGGSLPGEVAHFDLHGPGIASGSPTVG